MRPRDTHDEAREVQLGVYRRMSPERRAEIALELSEDVRIITREGIRQRHPEYSDQDVQHALIALIYGKDVARRLWPDATVPPP
jgi:hypothetical protein